MEVAHDKVPIALLIGNGSRIGSLIDHHLSGQSSYEVVSVISHKAMPTNNSGTKKDVVGVAAAKDAGINTAYLNMAQMRQAKEHRLGYKVDPEDFRREYSAILGLFLSQKYPRRPEYVLMQGFDLVLTEEALGYFPSSFEGVYRFINFHPAQLPDNPGDEVVRLSSGLEIPVIRGEHDDVIKEALERKLTVLGGCAHMTTTTFDEGGNIVARFEVPMYPDTDSLETYDSRLKIAESKFTLDVAEMVGNRQIPY